MEFNLKNIAIAGLVVALAVMAGSMLWSWYKPAPLVNPTQYTQAQPIKEVEKIQIVKVPGPAQIVTVEKERVIEKLKLPDEIAKDDAKQVVATAVVPPHEANTNAIAIMDTKTGESHIELKQEKPPFFAFKNDKEIGIRGGIGVHGKQVDIYGRYTFARVGRFHVAAYGEGTGSETGQSNGRAMLDLSYRW
jgi:hypothetical protein